MNKFDKETIRLAIDFHEKMQEYAFDEIETCNTMKEKRRQRNVAISHGHIIDMLNRIEKLKRQ